MATIQSLMANEKAKRQVREYQYPANIGEHYMILTFRDFKTKVPNIYVALPPPQTMLDSTEVNVGGRELGSIGGEALTAFRGSKNPDAEASALKAFKNFAEKAFNASETVGKSVASGNISDGIVSAFAANSFFAIGAIDSFAPGACAALYIAKGNSVHPRFTLTFDGVTFNSTYFPLATCCLSSNRISIFT